MTKLFVAVMFLLGAIGCIDPEAWASEIKVLSAPGMSGTLKVLGPKFESQTGNKMAFDYELHGAMFRKINAGERFDAFITNQPTFDDLLKRGIILPDYQRKLGRIGIVVWIRSGAPKPDISTPEAFKSLLLHAKSISYTKGSGAGVYIAHLIERLGIADQVNPKTKYLGGGGQNPRAVAAGDVEYGISIKSDGIGVSGAELLGPLPPRLQHWGIFTGGVAADTSDVNSSKAFIGFLASPENWSVMQANGFDRVRP